MLRLATRRQRRLLAGDLSMTLATRALGQLDALDADHLCWAQRVQRGPLERAVTPPDTGAGRAARRAGPDAATLEGMLTHPDEDVRVYTISALRQLLSEAEPDAFELQGPWHPESPWQPFHTALGGRERLRELWQRVVRQYGEEAEGEDLDLTPSLAAALMPPGGFDPGWPTGVPLPGGLTRLSAQIDQEIATGVTDGWVAWLRAHPDLGAPLWVHAPMGELWQAVALPVGARVLGAALAHADDWETMDWMASIAPALLPSLLQQLSQAPLAPPALGRLHTWALHLVPHEPAALRAAGQILERHGVSCTPEQAERAGLLFRATLGPLRPPPAVLDPGADARAATLGGRLLALPGLSAHPAFWEALVGRREPPVQRLAARCRTGLALVQALDDLARTPSTRDEVEAILQGLTPAQTDSLRTVPRAHLAPLLGSPLRELRLWALKALSPGPDGPSPASPDGGNARRPARPSIG